MRPSSPLAIMSRACLIKHEGHFDAFDRVFAKVFHGVEGSLDKLTEEVMDWLKQALDVALHLNDHLDYFGLTVAQLAASVGCSRRTLYELAPSKDSLVLIVLDRFLLDIFRCSREYVSVAGTSARAA